MSIHEASDTRTPKDLEAQQVARDAVMEIPLFPDLKVQLRGALGYGPRVDMLQHFCYWFHPRKPKMQKRWTLYKTYQEWYDECRLTDRQIRKGRKKLRELGMVVEKKGPHGRVHYRVDWVALAEILSLDAVADQEQVGHQGDQVSLDAVADQLNTGDYVQENSLLQSGGEPAYAEPPPRPENKKVEPQEVYLSSLPDTDKRHSQVLEPPRPKLSGEVEHKVWALIYGLPEETAVTRFADHFITNRLDGERFAAAVEQVAEKVREKIGGKEPLEAYTPFVWRCLEEKRAELELEEVAS